MIFSLMKNLPYLDRGLREGKWIKPTFKGVEITGKCLGIVGMGNIGRELAKLVKPLNMRILAFDPALKKDQLPEDVEYMDDLARLLRQADVVSLHCPLTDSTREMIGVDQLKEMKSSAFLINTTRGEVVDEAALVQALRDGVIAGAGLDSFASEPPDENNPLWGLPNVLVTPHIGGVTSESFRRMGMQAAENILSILDNKVVDLASVLNPEVL
jgi:D-3-phosphoglycerate dehydrogenase